MSSQRKVVRKHSTRVRHARDEHVCSGLPTAPTGSTASSFKPCGHNLAGAAAACGPPGDGKPLDLTQLSSEQRSKLESFLKSSGFGPLPKAGQTLDAATMRKLAQHMRAAAAMPSKTAIRSWGDNEKNPKDGLVRQAVSSSKRDDVKNLLEEGGDVDEAEPKTLCTPLMLAVRDGSKEIVQLLLDYDADVTRRDKDGKTAIMEACAAGRDDLVQLLIDHGSCVADTDNNNWNSLTHAAANGRVHCANVVLRHLKYDQESQEKLKEVVRKDDKKITKTTSKTAEKTATTAATTAASKTAASADSLDDYDDTECPAESALAVAAQKGQFDFVKWYLSHKEQFKVTEVEVQAACSKACYSKRLDLLRLLIEEHGAKVNPETVVAEIPLCAAAACGDLEMVKYLLQRGARVNDSDGSGFTPLMRACNEGNTILIPVLLHHGADVNAQNTQYENWTPLCFAVLKGNMEIVQTLLAAKANVNLGGTPPLLLAVSFSNTEAVEYLLKHDAIPTQKSLHGDAAITFAADVGNFEWVQRFHKLGCEVDCVGDKGHTPLMKAAKKGSLEIVEYLLDKGADINRVSTNSDCTALSLACSKGWVKIIECLLERGANRHTKLKDGITALLEAVKSGNSEAADLVLYHQPANVDFRDLANVQRAHASHQSIPTTGDGTKSSPMTPMKDFYMNMNYSCKHCDGHHGDPAHMQGASSELSSGEEDDEDDEDDEEDESEGDEQLEGEDEEGDEEECESGEEDMEDEDDEDYTSEEEENSIMADPENFELPEIYTSDLAELDYAGTGDTYDAQKEGLDADIDFIRTQLAHFAPQSFEFRILNAMLRKAEQLQKSLPNHTPEELRRRFSEEISRWQHELQSNANVDDLMDKLVTDPASGQAISTNGPVPGTSTESGDGPVSETDEKTIKALSNFLQANPLVLEYPTVYPHGDHEIYVGAGTSESSSLSTDSGTGTGTGATGPDLKRGVSLSPDGKYLIMSNSATGSLPYAAPLNDFEFLRTIAAAADAAASGGAGAEGMERLPEDIAKVMVDARRNGMLNMESFSTFFQGVKDDPLFLEEYRNAIRVPASFNFSTSTPPASLATPTVLRGATVGGPDRIRKSTGKNPLEGMPKLESRRTGDGKSGKARVVDFGWSEHVKSVVQSPHAGQCMGSQCVSCGQVAHQELSTTVNATATSTTVKFSGEGNGFSFHGRMVKKKGNLCKREVTLEKGMTDQTISAADDKLKLPRTPEPTPDDTSEDGFQMSEELLAEAKAAALAAAEGQAAREAFHQQAQADRSAKKTVRSTRDVATNVANCTIPPPKKPALVDVDQQQESDSSTALIHAAIRGNAKMIATLCDAGSKPNHKDKKGWTALGYAVERGHKDAVKELCEHGAELDCVMDTNQAKRDSSLTIACYNGRAEIVRILLDYKASIEHRNSNDYTPLCVACLNGHHRVAQMLIQRNADVNARGTKLGISPLMLAAMNGHTSIVKLLIESNADINQCIETNRNTALTLACFQGRTECVRVLVEKGANLEWRSKNGLNALMEAANGGFYEIGKILVDAGAEVDCAPVPSTKDTPLTIAAEKGHAKFVQLLIENDAAVNVRNKKGCSPLWLACQNGHYDCARAIVASGKADVDSRDNRQMSCILTAFKRGHESIVKTLVDHIHCYPSEEEMTRYCKEVKLNGNNSYLLTVYERCKKAILDAKHKKEAEADAKAQSLIEELDLQQKAKEGQRAKKRDKKKQKKKVGKEDDDSSITGGARTQEMLSAASSAVPSRAASPAPPPPPTNTKKSIQSAAAKAAEILNEEKMAAALAAKEEADAEAEDTATAKKRKKKKAKAKNKAVSVPPEVTNHAAVKEEKAEEQVKIVARPATAPAQVQPVVSLESEDGGEGSGAENKFDDEWVQPKSKAQKAALHQPSTNQTSQEKVVRGTGSVVINSTSGRVGGSVGSLGEGWKEVVGRSKRFKVPTSSIARIIGKGGVNINAIRAATCAHIEIEKNKPGINDRLITVKGTSEAVAEAYHIIQTLCDNPDRDLEDLLKETKTNSVAITNSVVSQPAGTVSIRMPMAVPSDSMAASKGREETSHHRIPMNPVRSNVQASTSSSSTTSHSTQVFTNSQMHSRGSMSSQPTNGILSNKVEKDGGHHPTGPTSMPSTMYQKRASIPSTLSYTVFTTKETPVVNHEAPKAVPATEGAATNVTVNREAAISPAPSMATSSSSQPSNRGSPASISSGPAQKTTMAFPPQPSALLHSPQQEQRSRPQTADTVGSSTSSGLGTQGGISPRAGAVADKNMLLRSPQGPPPVMTPGPNTALNVGGSAERPVSGHQQPPHQQQQHPTAQQLEDHGIYGTLYNDLLSERHVWTSDMDFFGAYGPPTPGALFNGAGTMSFGQNATTNLASQQIPLYNGATSSAFGTRGRPSSLPQDLRGTLPQMPNGATSAMNQQYRNMNGFGTQPPLYNPSTDRYSMFNGDGSAGGYGEGMVNGGHRRVSPLENEVSWNQHGGYEAGGYAEDFGGKEGAMDASKFMGVAQRMAIFAQQDQGVFNYGGQQSFGSGMPGRRMNFMGGEDFGEHDMSYRPTAFDIGANSFGLGQPQSQQQQQQRGGSRLMKSGIVEPVNMSGNDGGSLFARSGIFGALNTDLSAGDLSENQYEWHRGASAFNPYGIGVTVGGGGMQSGEFGSIADPVPNLMGSLSGGLGMNGGGNSSKTTQQQSLSSKIGGDASRGLHY